MFPGWWHPGARRWCWMGNQEGVFPQSVVQREGVAMQVHRVCACGGVDDLEQEAVVVDHFKGLILAEGRTVDDPPVGLACPPSSMVARASIGRVGSNDDSSGYRSSP